mmetsp:Transcript_18409/g.50779  ORF Transcript_18409/g.50779 Transcript_18409/m.50779 type:complete len:253 (-) Transcript_18409:488-1246(-)
MTTTPRPSTSRSCSTTMALENGLRRRFDACFCLFSMTSMLRIASSLRRGLSICRRRRESLLFAPFPDATTRIKQCARVRRRRSSCGALPGPAASRLRWALVALAVVENLWSGTGPKQVATRSWSQPPCRWFVGVAATKLNEQRKKRRRMPFSRREPSIGSGRSSTRQRPFTSRRCERTQTTCERFVHMAFSIMTFARTTRTLKQCTKGRYISTPRAWTRCATTAGCCTTCARTTTRPSGCTSRPCASSPTTS